MLFMISGVTSFLGRNAAKLLLERKHRVVGLVRPGSKNREKLKTPALSGLLVQELDFDSIPEAESCRRIFGFSLRGEGKEGLCLPGKLVFLHFSWDGVGSAGRSDPELQERNIRNAKKAFRIAEGLHASRFLFAGSQAEYGRGGHERPEPRSEYGKAKLAFGRWGMEQSSETAFYHLRIHSVYGSGDHEGSLVNALIHAHLRREAIRLSPCTQDWNYLEVRDLSSALLLLSESERAEAGIYDIASRDTRPLRSYVEEIWRILNEGSGGERLPERDYLLFGARGNNAEGDIGMAPDTAALRALGFSERISLRQGIEELLSEEERK